MADSNADQKAAEEVTETATQVPDQNQILAGQLIGLIQSQQTDAFCESIKNICEHAKENSEINLNYILNETFLLGHCAASNDIAMVESLVACKEIIDVNKTDMNNQSALFYAASNDNLKMVKLLMKHGANPNTVDATKNPTMLMTSAFHGNKEIMEQLLNVNNEYKHTFDWDTLVNVAETGHGYTAFHICCENGFLDCLQFLFSIESKFKVKINQTVKAKGGQTGFGAACNANCPDIVEFLLSRNSDLFDINEVGELNESPFFLNAYFGNLHILKLFVSKYGLKKCDICLCNKSGESPFHAACLNNQTKVVEWLLTNKETKELIEANDINKCSKQQNTPLMVAICKNNVATVDLLLRLSNKLQILQIEDSNKSNALDYSVFYGSIPIFASLLLTLFQRANVNDMASLRKSELLNDNNVAKWLTWCESEKNLGLLGFLTKMNEKCLKGNNFALLNCMLELSSIKTVSEDVAQSGAGSDNIVQIGENMRQAIFRSNYLFVNLKKETLMDLSNTINNAILKQECSFDDSLLFLSKLVNGEKFNQTLESITQECLTNERKNLKKYLFFKNNLLDSNIWAATAAESGKKGATIESKTNEEEEKDPPKNEENLLLFNQVRNKILAKELSVQKQFIKDEICKIEKNLNNEWQQLKKSIKLYNLGKDNEICQNRLISKYDHVTNFMKDGGIVSDYSLKEMPIVNELGFIGNDRYDKNGYLNKLLIAAHTIDPIFQNHCKEYFDIKNFGIPCQYSVAPVKTRERSIMKANLDYKEKAWPHTSNILDFLRGAVIFDNIESFLQGFNKFYAQFHNAFAQSHYQNKNNVNSQWCIKYIVRIKNDFASIKDESWNLDLNNFDYCDIKCNIVIEHFGIKMVGELQFLLSFMLKAKKLGHSIYSFLRKEELYNKLSNVLNNNNNYQSSLNKMIVSQNMTKLSFFFETLNLNEKYWLLKNKSLVTQLFDQNGWKKGKQLFELVVAQFEK